MSLTKGKLQESINRKVKRVEEIIKDQGVLDPTQEAIVETLLDDVEEEREQLERLEGKRYSTNAERRNRLEELTNTLSDVDDNHEPKVMSKADMSRLERLAVVSYLRNGVVHEDLQRMMPSFRAAQGSAGSAGGYTIPVGFMNQLERAVKSFSGMWEASTIWKTERGNSTPWSFTDDTDNKAYLVAESANISSAAQAVVFGKQDFEGYKYTSGLIQVPSELLEDSDIFSEEFIKILGERIGRGTNTDFTVGNGTNKPRGITASATYGTSTADDAALAYDDFVNLLHSVDPGYRNSDKCYFMFHDSVLKALRKIKDGSLRPIFQNLDSGILLGHEFIINNDLPAFTPSSTTLNDNSKIAFFGDFSRYKIRTVKSMRIVRLSERYGDQDQIAFAVLFRVDGDLMDPGKHPVKYLRVATS